MPPQLLTNEIGLAFALGVPRLTTHRGRIVAITTSVFATFVHAFAFLKGTRLMDRQGVAESHRPPKGWIGADNVTLEGREDAISRRPEFCARITARSDERQDALWRRM